MTRVENKDEKPHTLVIIDVDDDAGEVDWYLEHPGCLEHHVQDGAFSYSYYDCLVQHCLDDAGIYDIADAEPTQPFPLRPGRYELVAHYVYDHYTREADSWIEPYPDPSEWKALA